MPTQVGLPQVAGLPNLSSGGAGAATPVKFNTALLKRYYTVSRWKNITNTDYEGEIKDSGDTVKIRRAPVLGVTKYTKGQSLSYQSVNIESTALTIDHGKYYAFITDDVSEHQMDIPYSAAIVDAVTEAMRVAIDAHILGSIWASCSAANTGIAAGASSGLFNVGSAVAPITFNKSNAIDMITAARGVLTEQNIPENHEWFIIIPPWAEAEFLKSSLQAAFFSNSTDTLRNGNIGQLMGMKIYTSQNLPFNSTVYSCIFGSKIGTTFATQFVKEEKMRAEAAFGNLVRGVNVYGFEAVQPVALGTMYIQP